VWSRDTSDPGHIVGRCLWFNEPVQDKRRFEGDVQIETPTVKSAETVPAVEDTSYIGYVASALVIAVLGGFLLAILLPLAETGMFWEDRVPQLIQAHGWAQLQGWAGMFVAGMALRLIPRFAGRPPIPRSVTVPVLVLLVSGIVLRTIAEPFVTGTAGEALVVIAALLGAAGTLAVAATLLVTLSRGRRKQEPWRYFAFAGAGWWAAWAAFMVGAGLKSISNDRYVPVTLDDTLTWIVILGAIGNFVMAVQSRSVPVFFGRKTPKLSRAIVPGVLLNLGAGLVAVSLLPFDGTTTSRLEGLGLLLGGVALAWLAPLAGSVWGSAHRLRPRARSASRYVLGANVATVAGGICLAWAGAHTAWSGSFEAYGFRDAARHAFGLGMMTMLIFGMAQLVAPMFALERAEARPAALHDRLPFWLLIAAIVLRMAAGLLYGHTDIDARMHTAALAGVLGWLAIVLFAATVSRAIRNQPRMKAILFGQVKTKE